MELDDFLGMLDVTRVPRDPLPPETFRTKGYICSLLTSGILGGVCSVASGNVVYLPAVLALGAVAEFTFEPGKRSIYEIHRALVAPKNSP